MITTYISFIGVLLFGSGVITTLIPVIWVIFVLQMIGGILMTFRGNWVGVADILIGCWAGYILFF